MIGPRFVQANAIAIATSNGDDSSSTALTTATSDMLWEEAIITAAVPGSDNGEYAFYLVAPAGSEKLIITRDAAAQGPATRFSDRFPIRLAVPTGWAIKVKHDIKMPGGSGINVNVALLGGTLP